MNKRMPIYAVLLSLIAGLVAVSGGAACQEERNDQYNELIPQGQRIFACANSFLYFMPEILSDMANGAGIAGHETVGLSVIAGSHVSQHWDWPEANSPAKQALRAGEVDVLTLSSIYLPDTGIEEFTRLALENNPQVRVTIQETWLRYDEYDLVNPLGRRDVDHNAVTAEALRDRHEPYFQSKDDHIRDLNTKLAEEGKPVLFIVPVGQAVIRLREMIIAGEVPGLNAQSDLFRDSIGHPRAPLQVLSAYCHFGVIYQRSPVGLPVPKVLEEAVNLNRRVSLNRLLQEIAWEAVTNHPLSGVKTVAGLQ